MAKSTSGAQLELTVQKRTTTGKRRIRRLRATGTIPGIVYGKQTKPLAVAVNAGAFAKLLHSKAGEHALVTLRMEDDHGWSKPALLQAVQHDPVNGHVTHIDFHTIALTERLKVKVPLLLKGEAVGVKQEGGVLEHFLREIEVECLPTEIPANLEFDISAMKIGETIHVRDLAPPKQIKITSDPESPIASVQKPKEEKPEEAAPATSAEPEVIREKKEEAEEGGAAPAKGEASEAKEPKKEAKG